MAEKGEARALAGALLQADLGGPFEVELDAGAVICLVTVIQAAHREPATRDTLAVRQAVALARKLCAEVARRAPELYRFLERGWADDAGEKAEEGGAG